MTATWPKWKEMERKSKICGGKWREKWVGWINRTGK